MLFGTKQQIQHCTQWTANPYTITFNANGGSTPDPTSKSVTYDSTYGTLATTSRTGYNQTGWYTASSGGTKIETTSTVKLQVTILYMHNGVPYSIQLPTMRTAVLP